MKVKVMLAACAAALVLAACTAAAPTSPSSTRPAAPVADGVGTMGSGGFTDSTKTDGPH